MAGITDVVWMGLAGGQGVRARPLKEGLVTIGPAVRIGRSTEIGPGAVISEANVDDDVVVGEGAYIARSSIRDGAIVGPGATIRNSVVGSNVYPRLKVPAGISVPPGRELRTPQDLLDLL